MPDLPIQTVLSLDKVQKGIPLSMQELEDVVERRLVEEGPDGLRIVEPATLMDATERPKMAISSSDDSPDTEKRRPLHLKQAGYRRRINTEERNGLKDDILGILTIHKHGLSRNALTAELQNVLAAKGYADVERIDGETVYGMLKELAGERRVVAEGATRSRIWRLP